MTSSQLALMEPSAKIENRESDLMGQVLLGWLVTLFITFVLTAHRERRR